MIDRGMIKWEPFNAVIPSKAVIKSLTHEKERIRKPNLSEDQIKEIENSILEAFNLDIEVTLSYYQNGYIYKLNSKIKKIDSLSRKIYFNNKILYFNQILRIN